MKIDILKDTILKIFTKNKMLTFLLFASIILIVLSSLLPPQILRIIIDKNFTNKVTDNLLMYTLMYFGVLFFNKFFEVIKEVILAILGQESIKEIRLQMISKMNRLDTPYYSKNTSGYIVSRVMNDVDAIGSVFSEGLVGIMVDSLKIIGIIFSIYVFSKNLALLVIVFVPILFFITKHFKDTIKKFQIEVFKVLGNINNYVSESFKNIITIKTFSKEEYVQTKYDKLVEKSSEHYSKIYMYDSIYPAIVQIIKTLVILSVILLASGKFNVGAITLGMVVASVEYITNIFEPIESLGMEITQIQKAFSAISRVNEFLNEEEEEKPKLSLKKEDIIPNENELNITFDHVTFSYDNDKNILEDMNLEFNNNEKVAFIGRTGVGKSTLFKLLVGLLKPNSGMILLNGVDVYEIDNREKRKIFGYVDQTFFTVKGTIKDQITLYDDTITDDQINYAINYAGLSEFVNSQKYGLDTIVTKDVFFSKGEEQLFNIARSIVLNPPILILDEITANLDSITEEKIVNVLKRASKDRMIFSISHRISSMLNNDRIIDLSKNN